MFVYELKCFESDLGRYNATHVYTLFVVSGDEQSAISSVLKRNTITIEVVSVYPCKIL